MAAAGTKYQTDHSNLIQAIFSQKFQITFLACEFGGHHGHQSRLAMKTQGFFLLRRPLLSCETLLGFHKAAGNDPDLFESYLKLIFSHRLLQQTLNLASPQIHGQLLTLQRRA